MTAPVRAEAKSSARADEPRRKVHVSFSEQLRALYPVLVFGAFLVILTLALVWVPVQNQAAADPSPIVRAILGATLFRIQLWLVPLLVLSGSLAAIVALLHARRVAAAIQRLREGLVKLSVSDPEPVTFPDKDEFHELQAPFAGAVNRVQELTRSKLEMLRVMRHNLEGISQRAKSGNLSGPDLHESLASLMRDVDAEIKKLQMRS